MVKHGGVALWNSSMVWHDGILWGSMVEWYGVVCDMY